MEEMKLTDGDLVPDGAGGFQRLTGSQALVQRVLFKLSARRGSFPFLPELGSLLHTLGREKESARPALCAQYVRQALEGEDLTVTEVEYSHSGGQAQIRVCLGWQGEALEVSVPMEGE